MIGEQIRLAIKRLKNRESPGHDFKSELTKLAFETFFKPLTFLYNMSICSDFLLLLWKIAKVIPMYIREGHK